MSSDLLSFGIDISKIQRPVLGKKPEKPLKPVIAKKNKVEKKIIWRSTALDKKFNLVDIIKNCPKDLDIKDLEIWMEQKGNSSDYWAKPSVEIFVGAQKDIVDPKYTEAHQKYDEEIAAYNIDITRWEAVKSSFDEQNDLYEKYKDLVELSNQKKALQEKLKKN